MHPLRLKGLFARRFWIPPPTYQNPLNEVCVACRNPDDPDMKLSRSNFLLGEARVKYDEEVGAGQKDSVQSSDLRDI
ncbi:hypothetical protein BTUL_0420g00020 [Botrytis tulipae]|uniref:Uncharacterized protein n=1 Tax=Botrytis tulipae TaxID=87230 RepID=A0A4Z1E6T6_9HELO|nr:hypothetical protein BTUL_0420g00020 [Botrytis tulipae]